MALTCSAIASTRIQREDIVFGSRMHQSQNCVHASEAIQEEVFNYPTVRQVNGGYILNAAQNALPFLSQAFAPFKFGFECPVKAQRKDETLHTLLNHHHFHA